MASSALFSTTAAKVFASVVLVGGAASVAGLGTFGSFTSTTTASESVASGEVKLGLTQHGSLPTTLSASNLVPGDTVQRALTLTRSDATEKFGSVKMTTTAGTSNLLSTDATKGLQLVVEQCPVAWTKDANANTLSCPSGAGAIVQLASGRAVAGLVDLGAATTSLNSAAKAANLRMTLALPTAADNDFQGLSNTITFTFDATQRAAEAR